LFRIVSGSKAAKSLDGIGEIGGALDPFLQAQLEEAVEQTLIDRFVLILALGGHTDRVAHEEREGEHAPIRKDQIHKPEGQESCAGKAPPA
jgi:hypothetical protein